MEQRQLSRRERLVNKAVSHLSVSSAVTGIVKLDSRERPERLRRAQHKVDMLLPNLVGIRLVLAAFDDEQQIGQADFGANHGPSSHHLRKHEIKRLLGGREKVVTNSKGQSRNLDARRVPRAKTDSE